MKKLLFISLAVILALSVGLVGCTSTPNYTLTIASTDGGSVFPAVGKHTYASGQVVDIKATVASDSYRFVNWTGDAASLAAIADANAATTKITMNGDYSIRANFEALGWDSVIRLDMHLTVPNSFVSLASKVYIPWANGVMNHTGSKGGTFNITITYGPSPFGAEDSLAGISQGLADIGQLSGDTYDLGGIGYLPFMFPSLTSCAYVGYTILHDEVGTWDELAQLRDVKILLVSPLHSANWIGKTKNVILPADIVGVNVRAEAGELPTIAALGANPKTNIALNNLAGQMSGGYVDGGFVTYSAMISYGLLASTTYITQVNLFPRLYSLAINKDVYDGLPSEARQWLDSCCTRDKSVYWAQQHAAAEGYYKSQVVNNLTASGKPAIHVLTAGELDAWKSATSGVKTTWATDMTSLGYNGTALLNRVIALVAAAP